MGVSRRWLYFFLMVQFVLSPVLGTIKVYSSGRHTIRFDMVEKYGDKNYRFDMIQFIPATENQVWPMLDMKGNQIEEDSPEIDDIWPYK